MISTEERAPELTDTAPTEAIDRPDTRSWLAERISADVGVIMGATWYVLFMIGNSLEPATDATVPAWSVGLSLVFLATLAAMAVGLLLRRRWGLLASLGAAGIFTALSVACPVSGHNPIGVWWFGQMASALGLVAASAYALTRARA